MRTVVLDDPDIATHVVHRQRTDQRVIEPLHNAEPAGDV